MHLFLAFYNLSDDISCFNRHKKDSHTPEEVASAEYIEKESARQAKDAKEREESMQRIRKTLKNVAGYVNTSMLVCDRASVRAGDRAIYIYIGSIAERLMPKKKKLML